MNTPAVRELPKARRKFGVGDTVAVRIGVERRTGTVTAVRAVEGLALAYEIALTVLPHQVEVVT